MVSPRRSSLKLTWREFLQFPDDGLRHEIIGGDHYVTPPPLAMHQLVSSHIETQLYRRIFEPGLGLVLHAPIGLRLTGTDVVQPDILVLLGVTNLPADQHLIEQAPDLVVEILSPSTAARDKGLKKSLYARVGVKEYWIVDTVRREIERWVLRGREYHRRRRSPRRIALFRRPSISIDLTKVW